MILKFEVPSFEIEKHYNFVKKEIKTNFTQDLQGWWISDDILFYSPKSINDEPNENILPLQLEHFKNPIINALKEKGYDIKSNEFEIRELDLNLGVKKYWDDKNKSQHQLASPNVYWLNVYSEDGKKCLIVNKKGGVEEKFLSYLGGVVIKFKTYIKIKEPGLCHSYNENYDYKW